MIGTTELIVIAAVIFVLFGATAIPKFARSLGRAKKEFALGVKEGDEDQTKNGDLEKPKAKKQNTSRKIEKMRKKA